MEYVFTAVWCISVNLIYSIFAHRSEKSNGAATALILIVSLIPFVGVAITQLHVSLEGIISIAAAGILHTFLMLIALTAPSLVEERKTKKNY